MSVWCGAIGREHRSGLRACLPQLEYWACLTNSITLHAEVQGSDVDPWGNTRVGLEVTGQLSRGDYEMKFNQALGSGNVLVADKVKLSLDLSAVKSA